MPAPIAISNRGIGRGASSRFGFTVNQADIDRVTNKLENASGASLFVKMQKANLATADLIGKKAKQASPRRTGRLRKSVRVRPEHGKGGLFGAKVAFFGVGGRASSILVGPTAPHRHLIIHGHRIVTPGGRFTGRRTSPNPFMDRVQSGVQRELAKRMAKEWRYLLR